MTVTRRATLARIHRVRTLQLGLVEAEEARAQAQAASEAALGERIARLAAAVAPATGGGLTLGAAAHYRDRLHQSADAALARATAAADRVARAAAATRSARQDRSAVEKLIERVEAEARADEARGSIDDTPGRGKRHASC